MAEKVHCAGNNLQRIYFYAEKPSLGKSIEEIKNSNISLIERSLLKITESKEIKAMFFRLINSQATRAYSSKLWLLSLILLTISVGVLIGLAVPGFSFTPFLVIPIIFFVAGCVTGAVWLANKKKTLLESPQKSDNDFAPKVLSLVENDQDKPNPYPYSKILSKPTKAAKDLGLAQKAAEKLTGLFENVFYKEIQKSDLSSFMIKKPALKITFEFSNSGEVFLKCTHTCPTLKEGIQQFQQYEQKLKHLLGNDVQMNHIPITQVNNLPELVNKPWYLEPVYGLSFTTPYA